MAEQDSTTPQPAAASIPFLTTPQPIPFPGRMKSRSGRFGDSSKVSSGNLI
jgi:hypothetical protein